MARKTKKDSVSLSVSPTIISSLWVLIAKRGNSMVSGCNIAKTETVLLEYLEKTS